MWCFESTSIRQSPTLEKKVCNFVGGVVSPLLANLFLHYAFDRWMQRTYPHLPFERYADDAIVHCRTETEAQEVRQAIAERMQECRLELHPEKTKIVYCKDDDRRGTYPHEQFDFLGYTFRPRRSKNWKGKFFINFSPAVADKAGKEIRAEIRSWQLHLRSDKSHGGSVPNVQPARYGAGSNTTGGIIARRCIRSCVNWTVHWPAGPIGNTRSCVAICAGQRTGSHGFPGGIQGCLPTGRWACGGAPQREPYERRRSRTVLRGRGGETPPRYSPSSRIRRPKGGSRRNQGKDHRRSSEWN